MSAYGIWGWLGLVIHWQPDLASPLWYLQTGATHAAIAPRILGQILLVVVLGVIELLGWDYLGGDFRIAGSSQHFLICLAGYLGQLLLPVRKV